MRYYALETDLFDEKVWQIGDIKGVDNWRLAGPPVLAMDSGLRNSALEADLMLAGDQLDFSIAGYAGVPIVNFKALKVFSGYEGFTALPILIEGQACPYYALHIWEALDCFDESKSNFEKSLGNVTSPDYSPEYYSVTKLMIDPERTQGKHIFRVQGYLCVIAISEKLVAELKSAKVSGATFAPIT